MSYIANFCFIVAGETDHHLQKVFHRISLQYIQQTQSDVGRTEARNLFLLALANKSEVDWEWFEADETYTR